MTTGPHMCAFVIVRTDAGWHALFHGGNDEIVWTTEVYTTKRAAQRAVELLYRSPACNYAPLRYIDRRVPVIEPVIEPVVES